MASSDRRRVVTARESAVAGWTSCPKSAAFSRTRPRISAYARWAWSRLARVAPATVSPDRQPAHVVLPTLVLQGLLQRSDPSPKILFASDRRVARASPCRDAPLGEEVEHFPTAEAFADLKRGGGISAPALQHRELHIDVPLVGAVSCSQRGQPNGASDTFGRADYKTKFAGGRTVRAERRQGTRMSDMQVRRNGRRSVCSDSRNRSLIHRLRQCRMTGFKFEARERVTHKQASGRSSPRIARHRADAQHIIEGLPGRHRVMPMQLQQAHALNRIRPGRQIMQLTEHLSCDRVIAFRLGVGVEIERQIGAGQREARRHRWQRRPRRDRIRLSQMGQCRLQVAHRALGLGEVGAGTDRVRRWTSDIEDRYCLRQRIARGDEIAAPLLEQPQIAEHRGDAGALTRSTTNRQRLVVPSGRAHVIACNRRQVGKIGQIHRGNIQAAATSVPDKCRFVFAPRAGGIAERFGDEAKIVFIGRGPTVVAGAIADRERLEVERLRAHKLIAVLRDARQRPDGVAQRTIVTGPFAKQATSGEIAFGAVERAVAIESDAEVTQRRRFPGGVASRAGEPKTLAPHLDRRRRTRSRECSAACRTTEHDAVHDAKLPQKIAVNEQRIGVLTNQFVSVGVGASLDENALIDRESKRRQTGGWRPARSAIALPIPVHNEIAQDDDQPR